MIGLHHQMSYSPAAVAAAAAVSTGAPQRQSVSDQSSGRGKSSSGKQVIKQKQQQQALAKYNYNCEPLANQWQPPFEARLERYHYEYSDQLDCSNQPATTVSKAPAKTPVSGRQQRQQQQQVVVQVPARTAQPIVVESLVKCNRNSKVSSARACRRADNNDNTTSGFSGNGGDHSAVGWTSGTRAVGEQEQAGRHFLVQQHQRELAQQDQRQDNNQVLLIMSDDHKTGGGVPFIGRRLPDKSFGTSSSSRKPPPHSSAPNWDASQGQRGQQAPVIGRRSHRVSLTHLGQQLPTDQPTLIGPLPISARLQQDHQLQRRGPVSRAQAKCPSLSVLDAIADGPYLVMAQPQLQHQKDRLVHQSSEQQQLAQLRRHSRRSANGGSPGMRLIVRNNKPAAGLQSSISCSSLVSSAEQHLRPEAPVCQDECCRSRHRRSRQPIQMPSSSGPTELVRCKSKLVPSSSNLLQLTISSEPQCLMPCCFRPPPLAGTTSHYDQVSHEYALDGMDSQLGPSAGAHHYHDTCQANGSFGEPIVGAINHHHQQQLLLKSSSGSQSSTALLHSQQRRLSIDHSSQSSQLQHHRPPQHRQLHQRSPPPVPSKPKPVSSSYQHHQLAPDSAIMGENEHVTQMYESLAAELKAKLGNPNRAPILLPPKDYDTLSRQQGKLTGIELRRSTNPQLIGPKVRRSSSTSDAPPTTTTEAVTQSQPVPIKGKCDAGDANGGDGLRSGANKQSGGPLSNSLLSPSSLSPPPPQLATDHRKQQRADTSLSTSSLSPATTNSSSSRGHQHEDEAGSARSSGRGSQATTSELIHHNANAVDSLQRSRSNSSSGLGSISLGGRSPDSAHLCSPSSSPASKSSSSEDMRHPDHNDNEDSRQEQQHQYEELDQRRGKGIENHNPSKVSGGVLWNGRVEVPLKVNSKRLNGNTYLATKQIIY